MAKKPKTPTYDKGDLIAAAPNLFGVQPEVMAGALFSIKKAITKDEAAKKLKAFLTKEV